MTMLPKVGSQQYDGYLFPAKVKVTILKYGKERPYLRFAYVRDSSGDRYWMQTHYLKPIPRGE